MVAMDVGISSSMWAAREKWASRTAERTEMTLDSLPSERVQAIRYLQLTRQLVSCSADGGVAVWNMDTQREEVCIPRNIFAL